MLNQRRLRLLQLLLAAERPLSAAEIGRLLGCPKHSVRYDMEALAGWVTRYGCSVSATPGAGYALTGDREAVRRAVEELVTAERVPYEYALSPKERVRRILLELFRENANCTMRELADALCVSRSTVHTDLDAVADWAEKRGLQLHRNQSGLRLTGPEMNFRLAMVDLIADLVDEGRIPMLLEDVEETDALRALLQPLVPAEFWFDVGEIVRSHQVPELAPQLAVMVSRLSAGHTLTEDELSGPPLSEALMEKARTLARAFEERFGLQVPPAEVMGIGRLMQSFLVPRDASGSLDIAEESYALARCLTMMIQARLGVSLIDDAEFVRGLAMHLQPVRYRLRWGLAQDNPLLAEIKEQYPVAYRAADDVAKVLNATWNVEIPESEIGYIAIHIAAALERARSNAAQPLRALLVCGVGVGSSRLLKTRLSTGFPGLEIGQVTSSYHFRDIIRREQFDLVISTCALPESHLPVVQVSPLLNDQDQERLRQVIEEIRQSLFRSRNPVLFEVLPLHRIALDVEARDWREAIRKAGELLVRDGCVTERYVDAMIATAEELGPYVVFGKGFAMPHARPEDGVNRVGFALVRLRNPIAFGHPDFDPVDLIFALAAKDTTTHLDALLQLSMLFDNPEALATIRAARTPEEIFDLVCAVSAQPPGSSAECPEHPTPLN